MHRDARIGRWLGAGLLAYYLLTLGGHHYSIDGIVMFQSAKSLLFRQTVVLDPPVRWGSDIRVGHWGIGMTLAYAAGLFALSPVFAAAPGLKRVPYDPRVSTNPELYANLAYLLVSWLNPLLTAATATLVFHAARRLNVPARWSVVAALAYGVASPAATYARYDFAQPVAALGLTASILLLLNSANNSSSTERTARGWVILLHTARHIPLAGLAFGYVVLTRIEFLVLFPWFLVWIFLAGGNPRMTSRVGNGLLFTGPVVAAFFVHRWIEAVKYSGQGVFASAATFAFQLDRWFHFSPDAILEGLVGLLLSPGRGLLIFFPLAWLALPGLRTVALQRSAASTLVAGILVLLVALYGAFETWWAGICWGPRFLVPVLPFLTVAATAWAASDRADSRWRRTTFAVLAAVGVVISWNGILLDPNGYYGSAAARFGFVPDSGESQFRFVASPLVTGWPSAIGAKPDLLWVRLLDPSGFPPARQLADAVARRTGVDVAAFAPLVSVLGCSLLVALIAVAGRRVRALVSAERR